MSSYCTPQFNCQDFLEAISHVSVDCDCECVGPQAMVQPMFLGLSKGLNLNLFHSSHDRVKHLLIPGRCPPDSR